MRVLAADDGGAYTVSGTATVDPQEQRILGPFAIERVRANGEVVGTARSTFTGQRTGQR